MARSEEISLTGLQHQIYLRELLCPGTSLNNNGCVVHYRERVEASDLLAVIDEVILRHASLHVRFVRLGEQPSYRLEPPTPVPVTVRGFGELDTERPALGDVEDLAAFVARFCNAPFDLRAGEALVRFALVRSEREDLLVCSLHHLVSDGVSVGLLLKEIEDCYLERSGLRDVRNPARLTTFQRVLEAEAEYLGSAQEKEDERYWLSALEAPFDVVDLSKRPEASGQRNVAAEQAEFAVPSRVLKRLTRAARIASAAALCGSLALTLAKLEGLRRFVMGLAVHNRGSSQLQTAHGPVSNIVPLVLEVDPSTSFAAWAKQRVTRGLKLGLRHGRYPSFRMLHQLRQRFRLDALFETVFDFQVERLRSGERGHVELVPNDAQLHGLTVKCTQYGRSGDDLGVRFVYLREGFTRQQIEEVFARWMTLLEALARQPEVELGGVSLLTASELEQVRHFSRGPRVDIPEAAGIHDLVVASLQRAPSSTVLREAGDPPSSGQAVSAAEVLAGTARLARALRAAGVGREADSNREPIVGLLTDRGVARAFGVLAILRAGGSYCPLDPAYPEARLKLLIEDTAMPVILTDSQCRTEAVALAGETVAVVCIDEALKASDATDALEVIDGDASRLAYVIY
ncbi:MAG: condensation domain-containing protein, partial [Acidobacteriota bacterium]